MRHSEGVENDMRALKKEAYFYAGEVPDLEDMTPADRKRIRCDAELMRDDLASIEGDLEALQGEVGEVGDVIHNVLNDMDDEIARLRKREREAAGKKGERDGGAIEAKKNPAKKRKTAPKKPAPKAVAKKPAPKAVAPPAKKKAKSADGK